MTVDSRCTELSFEIDRKIVATRKLTCQDSSSVAKSPVSDGLKPGASVQPRGPGQCLCVDVFPDLHHLAVPNSDVEDPVVLERLIRGLDFRRSDADDQNPFSLRHKIPGAPDRSSQSLRKPSAAPPPIPRAEMKRMDEHDFLMTSPMMWTVWGQVPFSTRGDTGGFSSFVTSATPIATGRNEPVPGRDFAANDLVGSAHPD